jgi:GNAT superfamily N-acetyltransferase
VSSILREEILLRPSTFEEVLPVWRDQLWPARKSAIKPVSPIGFDMRYSAEIAQAEPSFWAFALNGKVVGTLSGYRTSADQFRCRGLFVAPELRGRGLSRELLNAAVKQARSEGCRELWSLPRRSAWPAYEAFGFSRSSDWFEEGVEFGPNCLAMYPLSQ